MKKQERRRRLLLAASVALLCVSVFFLCTSPTAGRVLTQLRELLSGGEERILLSPDEDRINGMSASESSEDNSAGRTASSPDSEAVPPKDASSGAEPPEELEDEEEAGETGSETTSENKTESEAASEPEAEPEPEPEPEPEAVYDKLICLTLDDGPGIYTDAFLDLLAQYDAKATFFMIGEQVRDFSSAVRRENEMGMEQANHSWNHKTLTKLSMADVEWEFAATSNVLEEVTGSRPYLVRPPGGGYNDSVLEHTLGAPVILWSIDTLDWKTKDPDATYKCVMEEARDGSIILCHEIYEATLEAARRFIPDLIAQGYRFVTVSEMAKLKGVSLEAGKTYHSF